MYNKLFLKKTVIGVGSSYIYASFGTRRVQIGQLFEAQCLLKKQFLKENVVDFEFFRKFKVSLPLD